VSALAERQHGVVSAAQLRTLGLERGAIEWRVRRGRLHRVHRGVYAVGHPRLTFRGRCWAAVLACGPRCAVSHRTAAALWDLLPTPGRLEVTTSGRGEPRSGIHLHRTTSLPAVDLTHHGDDRLPLTTPTRTLIDLAAVLTPHRLERVCHRAQVLRLLDAVAVAQRLAELPGRPARSLRAAMATLAAAEPDLTRSELEERFLALLGAHRLPRPLVNATVHGHEVDFLWPAAMLVAETDGAATHLTPAAFAQDRRRDAALLLAGYRVVRFTWTQVTAEPRAVAATLRGLLAAPRGSAASRATPPSPARGGRRGPRRA